MTVRREIAQPRRETGARRREGGRRIRCNTLTDQVASPPTCPLETRGQGSRSSGSAIAAEVLMNNSG
jgi:hypothetical protein